MWSLLVAATMLLGVQAAVEPGPADELTRMAKAQPASRVAPSLLEARELELTNLLQARLQTHVGCRTVGGFLGKGRDAPCAPNASQPADGKPTTTAQALDVPANTDMISPQFWHQAAGLINNAGLSTPIPRAASLNMAPTPPTPRPWTAVMQDPQQPLNTKLGGAIMSKLSGPVTPTPPPKQASIDTQFVAQCPMVLFEKNLSIRSSSCGAEFGSWIDPSVKDPLVGRAVLLWNPRPASGIFFGVHSHMTPTKPALFADIAQETTLTGYKFTMRNCLGIERWQMEENVYKVDSMGHVTSTLELHDITTNSEAFFLKYLIRAPTGVLMAESNLFRMMTDQVNFTEIRNGRNTGKLLGTATRLGVWTKTGWEACMSPTSPRGWNLYFPQDQKDHESVATVQDIRVAIAGAINLMAYRDENRGKDGLNTEGATRQEFIFIGGLALVVLLCIFTLNFCMVFKSSGLKEKLKKTLFDSEGAILPKHPNQHREPMMHPTY